jgi:hypothetical protein
MKMLKKGKILAATPAKIKVDNPAQKRGINTKGLIVVAVMLALAAATVGGYFGYKTVTQAANDRWGLAFEYDFERNVRNKIDVTDVRIGEAGDSIELYMLARPERGTLSQREFDAGDDVVYNKLAERSEEIVIYVWSREDGKGGYSIVSITVCGIESIVKRNPSCQTIQRFMPLAKRNLRWLGAASDRE